MLLGFDFMKENKIIMNCEGQSLSIAGVQLALNAHTEFNETQEQIDINLANMALQTEEQELEEYQQVGGPARLVQRINLRAGESKFVKIKLDLNLNNQTEIFVAPRPRHRGIIFENAFYNSHVDNDNIYFILAHNNTDHAIYLKQNYYVGTAYQNYTEALNHKNLTHTIHETNNLTHSQIKELRRQQLTNQDFNLEHLTHTDQQNLRKILFKHAAAFSKTYMTLGDTDAITPIFNLAHNFPIQTKPYKMAHNIRQYADKEIQKLLEAGIIENTNSTYAFPVVFVKKKSLDEDPNNVRYRMAIDYRLLNSIISSDPFPIPDIRQILQSIAGRKLYSVLDLHSAFFQIRLREEDKEKLAFVTENAQFAPRRLPFGTKISSGVFSRLIDKVLGPLKAKYSIEYFIDDVIVAADTKEEMFQILEEILMQLEKYNLTIEPSKVNLCMTEIDFLGFKINQSGYAPSQKNIQKITSFARPKNQKAVQSFLGLCNYFKTTIKDYANIVEPLTNLTKKKRKFSWSEEAETALQTIQQAILQQPTVQAPNINKQFHLITDCSKVATSAILTQEIDGKMIPIEFSGRKLKDSEKRYPSVKLELLAIYEGVLYFRNFLLGRKFTIHTDSKALTHYLALDKQSDIVARWLLRLQDFDFDMVHIQGAANPADFTSRYVNNLGITDNLSTNLFSVSPELTLEKVKEHQLQDSKLKLIIEDLTQQKHNKRTQRFKLDNKGCLMFKNKDNDANSNILIAPESLKETIIQQAHRPHFAFKKTYQAIKDRFYWIRMYQDVKSFCAKCIQCNKFKSHHTIKVPTKIFDQEYEVGQKIIVDIVGRLPRSLKQNNFILTIMDSCSRYLEAVPLRNIESRTIINALNDYFSKFGLCKVLASDNESCFKSREFKEFLQSLNIEARNSSIYHPTSQAKLERVHLDLKNCISSMCQNTYEWDVQLKFFVLAHNSSKHRSTGFTPALLFFGREITDPFNNFDTKKIDNISEYIQRRLNHMKEVQKIVKENEQKIHEETMKRQPTTHRILQLDDEVYLKQLIKPGALQPKFSGPYKIKRILRNDNYLLQNDEIPDLKPVKIHISKIFAPTTTQRSNQIDTTDQNDIINQTD